MDKIQVRQKIINLCKEYNIKQPDFNNYKSVRKCCDIINRSCPMCYRDNRNKAVVCRCEVDNFTNY